ncbi:hypothetical protein TrLO_g1345 [Triparma laevis f. longispina]|nr:hypothetical protein TrLO_g1345 [Triparma laevis f. longispina]
MSICKTIEVVFEAVPATIVQIYALLLAEEQKFDSIISVLVSASTIAFTSSMLSYDWDTAPKNRKETPAFYGFIPDKALDRAMCFISMMALTFAHVLLQIFSCALLAITNTSWLIYFVLADFGSYFLWKIARNYFHYWANVDGILRYTISIISRVGVKIMVDYTLMIQLRHPWEYGGFPFLCSILISIAASFVSAYLYLNHNDDSDDEEDDTKLDEGRLRVVLGSLYLFWLISAISLVATMKRKYLRTFFSIEKGKEYSRKYFLSLQGDQEDKRHVIFFDNPDVYRKWGEELIKPWTLKNWIRWEEKKPAWFTVKWVEHVPNHYIPYDFRVKYKKTQGRVDDPVVEQRRRSSIQQIKSLLGVEEER